MFGIGGKKGGAAENAVDDDAFKDFAFAKEDMELKDEAGVVVSSPAGAPTATPSAASAAADSDSTV